MVDVVTKNMHGLSHVTCFVDLQLFCAVACREVKCCGYVDGFSEPVEGLPLPPFQYCSLATLVESCQSVSLSNSRVSFCLGM